MQQFDHVTDVTYATRKSAIRALKRLGHKDVTVQADADGKFFLAREIVNDQPVTEAPKVADAPKAAEKPAVKKAVTAGKPVSKKLLLLDYMKTAEGVAVTDAAKHFKSNVTAIRALIGDLRRDGHNVEGLGKGRFRAN